ncbi:MAG: Hsp20/alpha crystallin family protein [Planctomycetia bacterium]|jgi:HSP20 family protein|nr:Hsp20/alpha crystallin family protein [Planctomycetia bacterium]MCC7314612.1 Hsp20/alpha crystallin family protein [Planctomycetota bacterium]OQZ05198.1 MAG: hypothetical protein B6D36_11430 [Planctomycetes bacterium UTPLA1]
MTQSTSDSSHFGRLIIRGSITAEELYSGQYIRYCPTDAWRPNLNIYESADSFLVCIDLAGMKVDGIHVDVQDKALVIRGERTAPMPPHGQKVSGVHLMEIDMGVFCRQVELPAAVNRDEISAQYREGLLWVTLPKRA